jgi:hypothetical protein
MNQITLTATADNRMLSDAPTTNYGTVNQLDVGHFATGDSKKRCLVKFDLSSVPVDATVISATFRIYDSGTDFTSNSRTMSAYRCLRAWTELGSTWNTYDGSNGWGTAGADSTSTDRESAAIGSVVMPDPAVEGYVDLTFTPSLVQQWVRGEFSNNGVVLRMATEANDMHRFLSREDSTNKPQLVVTYQEAGGFSHFM